MSCMALYKLCPCLDLDAFDAVASSFVMSTLKLFPFSASFISSSYVCQSYDVKICYRPQGKIMFSEVSVYSRGSPSSIQRGGISVYRGIGGLHPGRRGVSVWERVSVQWGSPSKVVPIQAVFFIQERSLLQGLFVPFTRVGSGEPVRVLRLFHNKYIGYN